MNLTYLPQLGINLNADPYHDHLINEGSSIHFDRMSQAS